MIENNQPREPFDAEVVQADDAPPRSGEGGDTRADAPGAVQAELNDAKDRYVRLYAEFENYRKKVAKDKEELSRYAQESLMIEILPFVDNLEMCLKHSAEGQAPGAHAVVKGVENTLRELKRTLEKFGLTGIEALGKPFDPAFHHAMTQAETANAAVNTVVEEFRKGYLFREKVLRPSLVAVSKQPSQ